MTTITKLPDLSKSFEKQKLILDLETRTNKNTSIGMAILKAIKERKVPVEQILQFVREQTQDNPKLMANAIGEDLVNRILNYIP